MAGGGILGALLLLVKTRADISGLNKTDKALKQTKNSMKSMSKDLGLIGKLSKGIFGFMGVRGIAQLGSSYLQFEKDLGAINSRFYAITKDQQQATEEFNYIRKVAKDTAMDIKKTADSYSIFYSSTSKTLGKEGARGVFEDWTRVGRVLHLSEYQFERVTYALREMASKGAIYSQDLRMQIGTHVPNAMGLAQKASEEMGITGTDWFEKLQEKAKGNTKITTEFVRLFSKQARLAFGSEEAFRKAMQQPDALAQQIRNFKTEFGIQFSQAGGSYMVVKILDGVLSVLKAIPFDRITNILGRVAQIIGNVAQYMPQIVNLLKIIAINFIIAKSVMGIMKVFKFFSTAFMAFKRGNLLRWLLLKFGGPFGKSIVETLIKATARTGARLGLGALIKLGLNFIPIIGQIFTAITAIQILIEIIKNILPWGKDKINKDMLGNIYASYGTNPAEFYRILKDITSNKGITNTQQLQEALSRHAGGTLLAPNATYQDNGQIYITIDGANLNAEDILKELSKTQEKIQSNKIKKFAGWFDRPKVTENKGLAGE